MKTLSLYLIRKLKEGLRVLILDERPIQDTYSEGVPDLYDNK